MDMGDFNWGNDVLQGWRNFREWAYNSPYLLENWQIINDFYGTLDILGRQYLDSIFSGNIFDVNPNEVLEYLDYLAWNTPCPPPNIEPDLDLSQEINSSDDRSNAIFKMEESLKRMQVVVEQMCTDLNIELIDASVNENETSQMHDFPALVEMDPLLNNKFEFDDCSEPINETVDESFPLNKDLNLDQCKNEQPRELESRIDLLDDEDDEGSFVIIDNSIKDPPPLFETALVWPSDLTLPPTEILRTHSEPVVEYMPFNQADIDRELDELELLIYEPKTHISHPETGNDECCDKEIELSNCNSLAQNFEDALSGTLNENQLCVNKLLKDPPRVDAIDFIIPIYHPKVDPLLLYYAHHFSLFPYLLKLKYLKMKKNRNWLGDFPFWEEFGSMEFMPARMNGHLLEKFRSSYRI